MPTAETDPARGGWAGARFVDDRTEHARPVWRLWAPVIVSLLVQVPATALLALHGSLDADAGMPVWPRIGGVLLAIASPFALLAARRLPGPTVAAVAVLSSGSMLAGPVWGPPAIALAFATGSGIVRGARRWTYPSLLIGWVSVLAVALAVEWPLSGFRVGLTTILVIAAVLLAEGLRTRRERILEYRRRQGERRITAAQEERMRIARELHDVIAHSLAQITVQAGMGLHLMDAQPERAREALSNIKASSKTSLDEVRGLLDVLRGAPEADDPTAGVPRAPGPGLGSLPLLVESLHDQGVEASLVSRITTVPGAAVQLALYRIAQESVTNTIRHARASRVDIELVQLGDVYRLTVTDDGVGLPVGATEPGNGLLGMTERAELLGGDLETGPGDAGGFRVVAHIPVQGAA